MMEPSMDWVKKAMPMLAAVIKSKLMNLRMARARLVKFLLPQLPLLRLVLMLQHELADHPAE